MTIGEAKYFLRIRLVVFFFRIIQRLAPGNCMLHIHAGRGLDGPEIIRIPNKWIYEFAGGERINRVAPTKDDLIFGISFFI